MFDFEKLTENTKKIVINAKNITDSNKNSMIENIHVLCSAINSDEDNTVNFLEKLNLKNPVFKGEVENILKYFLPTPGSTYNVTGLFYQCEILTGIVPADKLWNNKQVTWTGTSTCFDQCSDEIRSQVPVSWGGTASDDIIEKSLEEKYNDLLAIVESLSEEQ